MKISYFFLISLLAIILYGCEDSDSGSLELSQTTFNDISSEGTTLKVDVISGSAWKASTTESWCILSPQKGSESQTLTIEVEANPEQTERTATITVNLTATGEGKEIKLTQNASEVSIEAYHYNLPVIFHVLYQERTDPLQYVSPSRLSTILDAVNSKYKDVRNSVDMNLTFKLATIAPDGKQLAQPGVEYIEWAESYPIDCDKFMNDNSGKYAKLLWDPNKYINVMIYNFKTDNPEYVTLGISHLPFSTSGQTFLEGLNEIDYTSIQLTDLKFPYSVSINSLYINKQSTSTDYYADDVIVTLAHELGHYLGLHHVFSETETDIMDDCVDTDYCKDTPSYNKIEYDDWLRNLKGNSFKLNYLAQRNNCQGVQFTSKNIMDYAFSFSNQFTHDQRTRIRHVLNYSPLIPGPKKLTPDTRTAPDGPINLPIRIIK